MHGTTTPPPTSLELPGGRWVGRVGGEEGGWEVVDSYIHYQMLGVCKRLLSLSSSPLLFLFSSPLPPLPPLRVDDELLEVIGLYSFLHVGKIQVSLAEPLRLGQASEIKVLSQCGGGVAALCL